MAVVRALDMDTNKSAYRIGYLKQNMDLMDQQFGGEDIDENK